MLFCQCLAKTLIFTQFSACCKKYLFQGQRHKNTGRRWYGSAVRVRGGGQRGGNGAGHPPLYQNKTQGSPTGATFREKHHIFPVNASHRFPADLLPSARSLEMRQHPFRPGLEGFRRFHKSLGQIFENYWGL